jgi:hypothetical protein
LLVPLINYFHFAYVAEETDIQFSVGTTKNEFELPFFEIAIIEDATRNFSFNNKIGEGGFGPVYKVNFYPSSWLIIMEICYISDNDIKHY